MDGCVRFSKGYEDPKGNSSFPCFNQEDIILTSTMYRLLTVGRRTLPNNGTQFGTPNIISDRNPTL